MLFQQALGLSLLNRKAKYPSRPIKEFGWIDAAARVKTEGDAASMRTAQHTTHSLSLSYVIRGPSLTTSLRIVNHPPSMASHGLYDGSIVSGRSSLLWLAREAAWPPPHSGSSPGSRWIALFAVWYCIYTYDLQENTFHWINSGAIKTNNTDGYNGSAQYWSSVINSTQLVNKQ